MILPLSISTVQVDKACPISAAGIMDRKISIDFNIINIIIVVPIKCNVLYDIKSRRRRRKGKITGIQITKE